MPEPTEVQPNPAAQKQIYSYQPKDKDGNPVGHPVQFHYTTQEELIEELAKANHHANVRLSELKRNRKPELQNVDTFPARADEGQLTAELQDPAKRREAVNKIIESEVGEPADVIAAKLAVHEIREFLIAHPDFYQCEANRDLMQKFLQDNNLRVTANNLSAAYLQLKDDLVKKPVEPVAQATPEVPPSQPNTPTISDTTRGSGKPATTGIIPGQFSNRPPANNSQGLTPAKVQAMSRSEWRAFSGDPKNLPQLTEYYRKYPNG